MYYNLKAHKHRASLDWEQHKAIAIKNKECQRKNRDKQYMVVASH